MNIFDKNKIMNIQDRIVNKFFKTFFPSPKDIFTGIPSKKYLLKGNGFDFGNRNGGKVHAVEIYRNAVVWPRHSAVMDSSGRLVAQTLYDRKRQEQIRRVLFKYPTKHISGYATSIDFIWSGYNHYHQLIDLHSRLWSLQHKSLCDLQVTILHPFDFKKDYITLMQEIAPNISFVKASGRLRYKVENYIHLPFLSRGLLPHLVENSSSIGYLPTEFLRFHQNETDRIFPSKRQFSKYIYISRQRAKTRKLLNEKELKVELEKIGFETVYFENMSLADQFSAVREAKFIVGIHGAGMANILSAKRSPHYLEVWSGHHGVHPCLSALADVGFIKYDSVYGDAGHIHDDFNAPVGEIIKYVTKNLGKA
jgi:hypothetical protein